MENDGKGIAWVGNMFQKFEDICLEVDDIVRQEGFKYVEGQLQTVGANVKQFCSEFVRDVLSTSFEDTGEDPDDKLSFVAKDDVGNEILKDEIAEDHFKNDLSCSFQSMKGKEKEPNSEEDVDARKRLEVFSILEKWLEEKYTEHLMLDIIQSHNKDESLSTLLAETDDEPGSSSYTKTNYMSDSCERMLLNGELISSGASVESIGKQGNLMGGMSDLGSSYEEKLDGSCIVVDRRELGYVSGEARSFFFQREEAVKLGHDHPAEFSNSNLGSIQQKEKSLVASGVQPNDGSLESDWEIV